jgi:hypothetical protein
MAKKHPLLFVSGLALILAVTVASMMWAESNGTDLDRRTNEAQSALAPQVDIRREGPLLSGERISLEEADAMFRRGEFPRPATTEGTGPLIGIWRDALGQVAFVWDTELSFYVDESEQTEDQALVDWSKKAADPTEPYWSLVEVRGHTALAGTGEEGSRPSSLTFIERGKIIQFIGPGYKVDSLRDLAEKIEFR